jgi:N-acetyl-anhydromuramyl-L-alanine amidase AmpD
MQPSEYGLGVQWIGSPNFDSRSTNKTFVVVHWSVTTGLAGIDATFNQAGGLSAHYSVGGSQIHQYVNESQVAWHAYSYNTNGIGIEHVGGTPGPDGVRIPPATRPSARPAC